MNIKNLNSLSLCYTHINKIQFDVIFLAFITFFCTQLLHWTLIQLTYIFYIYFAHTIFPEFSYVTLNSTIDNQHNFFIYSFLVIIITYSFTIFFKVLNEMALEMMQNIRNSPPKTSQCTMPNYFMKLNNFSQGKWSVNENKKSFWLLGTLGTTTVHTKCPADWRRKHVRQFFFMFPDKNGKLFSSNGAHKFFGGLSLINRVKNSLY